jgi:hypothetical protein
MESGDIFPLKTVSGAAYLKIWKNQNLVESIHYDFSPSDGKDSRRFKDGGWR